MADSATVQHGDDGRKVMYVKAKCGEMLEIDISDKERPKEFKVREGGRVSVERHCRVRKGLRGLV